MKWQQAVRDLPMPLSQWLSNSQLLTDTTNTTALLVVDDAQLIPIVESLPLISKVMAIARGQVPTVTTLLVVHGDHYNAVEQGFAMIATVRPPRGGQKKSDPLIAISPTD